MGPWRVQEDFLEVALPRLGMVTESRADATTRASFRREREGRPKN